MLAYTIFGVMISGIVHISATKNVRHVLKRERARDLENTCPNWNQMGDDIKGDKLGDKSGNAVAISRKGKVVVIGAVGNDDEAGYVRIYDWKKKRCSWKIQKGGELRGEKGDKFGSAVSISRNGKTIAVGALSHDENKGYIVVYKRFGKTQAAWRKCGVFVGTNKNDYVGAKGTVSMSDDGKTVAFADKDITGVQILEVIVDRKNCNINNLDQLETVDYTTGKKSVALSGDGKTVAVGTTHGNGHVEVFKYTSSAWNKYDKIFMGDKYYDNTGQAVSLSYDGTVLAIGADLHDKINDDKDDDSGNVRVYKINGNDVYKQFGQDIDGENAKDSSGVSVSLSKNGRLVAIGAHLNDENGNQAGHVRVYKYIKKGGWSQIGGDIDGKSACSQSGLSVSISDKTIAIGAPGSSCSVNDFDSAGYVRVMKLEDSCGAKKISKRKVCTTPSEQPSGQPSKQTKTPKSRRLNN